MTRWLGIGIGVLLGVVTATTAFAWENAPPVVDCAGITHPALSYATEAAYNAAVQQTCPPTSPPNSDTNTPRHLVAICHNEDSQKGMDSADGVQSVQVRNVAPDQVPKYLAHGDWLMRPGTNCGPTVT